MINTFLFVCVKKRFLLNIFLCDFHWNSQNGNGIVDCLEMIRL